LTHERDHTLQAASALLRALYRWDDLVFTHVSARVPGPENHFLINPYGMLFEEITASSLIKADEHGTKLSDSPFPVNPAGFVMHSTIHAARATVTRAAFVLPRRGQATQLGQIFGSATFAATLR
jgi:ribulose-5-phosphate 4-epimerase/fuculose-1-phosphate aldolase